MMRVYGFLLVFGLAFLASQSLAQAQAEMRSQPPEVLAGGEIVGQYYVMFGGDDKPHILWVRYGGQIFLCRGALGVFDCVVTEESLYDF